MVPPLLDPLLLDPLLLGPPLLDPLLLDPLLLDPLLFARDVSVTLLHRLPCHTLPWPTHRAARLRDVTTAWRKDHCAAGRQGGRGGGPVMGWGPVSHGLGSSQSWIEVQ